MKYAEVTRVLMTDFYTIIDYKIDGKNYRYKRMHNKAQNLLDEIQKEEDK